jgi:SAM-dependent methyltransferase
MSVSLYDDPRIYDILTTPGTTGEVENLERLARKWVRARARTPTWLEPACGTGRYLRVAVLRGHRVVGFDRDAGMIEYARQSLKKLGFEDRARLFVAEMTEFASLVKRGSVQFAFNPFNTLRHLRTDTEVLLHLRGLSGALAPGGIYAVGLSLTRYGEEPPEEDVWEARRGCCRVQQLVQYLPPEDGSRGTRRERVVSHLAIERPGGTEHRDSTYDLRCYDLGQWRRLVARSAMRLVATVDPDGEPVSPGSTPYTFHILEPR